MSAAAVKKAEVLPCKDPDLCASIHSAKAAGLSKRAIARKFDIHRDTIALHLGHAANMPALQIPDAEKDLLQAIDERTRELFKARQDKNRELSERHLTAIEGLKRDFRLLRAEAKPAEKPAPPEPEKAWRIHFDPPICVCQAKQPGSDFPEIVGIMIQHDGCACVLQQVIRVIHDSGQGEQQLGMDNDQLDEFWEAFTEARAEWEAKHAGEVDRDAETEKEGEAGPGANEAT